MKKRSFYSYLVKPVRCIADFTETGLATHTTGHFPLASDLPLVENLRKKRIYLIPIKSYYYLAIADVPNFLKEYDLQICKNTPNYLGGLPVQVSNHLREFDDHYIVALNYPDGINFEPAKEGISYMSGPLGLMFRESGISITIVSDIYSEFSAGKCIILAEKLRK